MAEFLGLGAGKLGQASVAEPLARGVPNRRRGDQKTFRQLQVAVVLQHAGKGDLRCAQAVKAGEVSLDKGAGDFNGAVTAKVVEHHRVTVLNGANRLAKFSNHKLWQVLVNGPRVAGAQAVNSGSGVGKLRPVAQHMGFPALFNHRPIRVVTVHGDVLAAPAGSDASVKTVAAEFAQKSLEWHHIVQRAGLGHVAPVKQGVDAHFFHPLKLGTHHHGFEVVNVAVHIAVRKQANEVDHAPACFGASHDLLPGLALPDRAVGDRVGDQRRTLAVDLPGTDGVVANLGVAHVVVRGHAHGRAMGAQADVGALGHQSVQRGFAGGGNGAANIKLGNAIAVHDDDNNWAGHAGKSREFLKHGGFLSERSGNRSILRHITRKACVPLRWGHEKIQRPPIRRLEQKRLF